jgi:simple sugar transport system ATP-binding protein
MACRGVFSTTQPACDVVSAAETAVQMQGITKRFGPVQALRGADFALAAGEVHALLGENGAGKSTLMQVLYGLLTADAGTVTVGGRALPPGSPRQAMAAGIGMVHQHFSQVARMTVAENVGLGRPGLRFDRAAATAEVRRVGEWTGLVLDPAAVAGDLPAGLRQRLEIVKALAREVRVLLLDEPTAALTPREVDDLFAALRTLVAAGIGVVLITHKMREVKAIADRVTVLRRGEVVLTGPAGGFTPEQLGRAMVGESAGEEALRLAIEAAPAAAAPGERRAGPVLVVQGVTVAGMTGAPARVREVSLNVEAQEIVGIVAVEGNGQRELMRAVAGLEPFQGTITTSDGGSVGFIPEDRQHEGLILDFTITDNMALGAVHGLWMDRPYMEHEAALAIEEYAIRTPGPARPVSVLSGGNQQRVVLARELGRRPALLVAENPTRGLDVRATADVHARLRSAAREQGLGVLFYSTDLDEVLAVADRIGVMVNGTWQWVSNEARTREQVGALMLGGAA